MYVVVCVTRNTQDTFCEKVLHNSEHNLGKLGAYTENVAFLTDFDLE